MDAIIGFFTQALHIFFNLGPWLNANAPVLGSWLYVILFVVIFAETGLVVTPFLPGDSLIFAVGALCALPDMPIQSGWMFLALCAAGILGNTVNYAIGYRVGPKVFASESSRLFNKKYLMKAQRFYERYGGKTIILARFVPIIRTFAPFVAGIGKMSYKRYFLYNCLGTIPWVGGFVFLGYFFGGLEWVKSRFHLVVVAIIIISIMPAVIEFIREWRREKREAGKA
jgi:membrane-associated protein